MGTIDFVNVYYGFVSWPEARTDDGQLKVSELSRQASQFRAQPPGAKTVVMTRSVFFLPDLYFSTPAPLVPLSGRLPHIYNIYIYIYICGGGGRWLSD